MNTRKSHLICILLSSITCCDSQLAKHLYKFNNIQKCPEIDIFNNMQINLKNKCERKDQSEMYEIIF